VALAAGLLTVVIPSIGTDSVLQAIGVYPPLGQPMFDPGLNLLALTYRCIYGVAGSWVAARLAPHSAMRHALALGVLGLVLATAGAIVAVTRDDLGPDWYPISLVITGLPCAWLGGALHRTRYGRQ
jgi:hypothetical protein